MPVSGPDPSRRSRPDVPLQRRGTARERGGPGALELRAKPGLDEAPELAAVLAARRDLSETPVG